MDDFIVVVTDKTDPRFGQIGKFLAWDFKERGIYMVQFPNSEVAYYLNGKEPEDPENPVTVFCKNEFAEKFNELFNTANIGKVERR